MNRVIESGRLVGDPEMRYTADGSAVARYRLAVNAGYGDNRRTDFFDCVCFGKTAQFAETYLKKGNRVFISGSLQQNAYTTKDGQKRSNIEIRVLEHEFVDPKTVPATPYQPEAPSRDDVPEFLDIPEDDGSLPFV